MGLVTLQAIPKRGTSKKWIIQLDGITESEFKLLNQWQPFQEKERIFGMISVVWIGQQNEDSVGNHPPMAYITPVFNYLESRKYILQPKSFESGFGNTLNDKIGCLWIFKRLES